MLGGQWTGLDGISGVWPTMHTNTSRILTAFSDLEHDSDLVFPSNRDILAYLHRYAETFALTSRIRFGTRVEHLSRGRQRLARRAFRHDRGLRTSRGGQRQVPIALDPSRSRTRHVRPAQRARCPHTDYREPHPYLGKRVLVAGGAISALEIASELAQLGAARVVVTQRRQRYVLPKFAAGVPSDHRIFTRYGTLANETLPAGRNRPAAQGDRRRSRWKPGAVRRAGARPVAVRRRRHPRPAVPAAGGGGPNHGAAVADIGQRRDGDLRRRVCRGVRRNPVRHRVRAGPAVSE